MGKSKGNVLGSPPRGDRIKRGKKRVFTGPKATEKLEAMQRREAGRRGYG